MERAFSLHIACLQSKMEYDAENSQNENIDQIVLETIESGSRVRETYHKTWFEMENID